MEERSYLPLVIIIGLIVAAAGITSGGDVNTLILHGMAGFFLVFGAFKVIDLKGFVDGYSTYDLLAMRWRGYGYLYPFIELAFGFSMLAGFHPDWLLWSEAGLMIFSGAGVLVAMKNKIDVKCVCLGTVLKVPLTFVTLIEDFGMATLALVLIFIF